MSLPPETHSAIDDTLSRLATEAILAQAGSDEGMLPAYSLLGDLAEHCAASEALRRPIAATMAQIESHLDAALPFDEALLDRFSALTAWLPDAVEAVKAGGEPVAFADEAVLTVAGSGDVEPAESHAENVAQSPAVDAQGGGEPGDVLLTIDLAENGELLREFFAESVEHLQQIESSLLQLEQEPDDPEALNSIFRSFHTFKGNAGFLGLVPMQTLAHELESLLDLARNRKLALTSEIVTQILLSRDALHVLTQQLGRALEEGHLPDQIVPVANLIRGVRALANGQVACVPAVAKIGARAADGEEGSRANAPSPDAVAGGSLGAMVRVKTDKLDSLMNVVGELVIVQSQLLESSRSLDGHAGSPLQRQLAQLGRLTKELQGTAMSLRMIPIKSTFQKMERLVRDLARDFDRTVNLEISGEGTELDRTVVEEIGDPLVHMVRNAVDHGLETPAERVAAGKPAEGTLLLRAYHQSSNIVIELQDDGRGMNPEAIFAKAVEKGLVAPGTKLSRAETLSLIMAPGFSTAAKVTSVSGRGVGMDVVKRNIEKLHGTIELESELGRGSTVRLKLPLTTAIIDGLLVRVGADRFILPTAAVQVALRPERTALTTIQGKGEVLDHRGRILPLHRLHRQFAIAGAVEDASQGVVVIVANGNRSHALLVDELLNKQEVVIKNLGGLFRDMRGVSGGAILGDGEVALILDPASLCAA